MPSTQEGRALYRLSSRPSSSRRPSASSRVLAGEWDRCPTTASACTRGPREGAVGARPRPSSAENRPAIDPSEPILAVSPNFDRATDRRQPNHSTPNSDPQADRLLAASGAAPLRPRRDGRHLAASCRRLTASSSAHHSRFSLARADQRVRGGRAQSPKTTRRPA